MELGIFSVWGYIIRIFWNFFSWSFDYEFIFGFIGVVVCVVVGEGVGFSFFVFWK